MLAKKFHPRYWRSGGMFVQPKLNGLRCMYQNGVFMAREGLPWSTKCLKHLRWELRNLDPNIILDGELYMHGFSLQQINSRVGIVRTTPHPSEEEVQYWVFDIVDTKPFYYRHNILGNKFKQFYNSECLVLVPTVLAPDIEVANWHFSKHKQQGYEGAMLRDPAAPYSLPEKCGNKENRVTTLLKLKDWLDIDVTILHVNEGTGQFQGMCGSLHVQVPNGTVCDVGSGISHREREWLWTHRDTVVGWPVKVKYEMLSDTQVLLKPTIVQIPNLTLE